MKEKLHGIGIDCKNIKETVTKKETKIKSVIKYASAGCTLK